MRLPVFYYPLQSWVDAVVMNVLQGLAAQVQLAELAQVSYTPFAESIRAIQPGEKEHLEQGIEALKDILHHSEHHAEVQDSVKYWQDKVAAGFSQAHPERYEMGSKFGIRHTTNERMLAQWTHRCTEWEKTLNLELIKALACRSQHLHQGICKGTPAGNGNRARAKGNLWSMRSRARSLLILTPPAWIIRPCWTMVAPKVGQHCRP